MGFCLIDGALLAMGTGDQPVDLVLRRPRIRVPLSGDEASVAMLLIEAAASEEELLQLAHEHGVKWTAVELGRFLAKLSSAGLVSGIDLPEMESPATEAALDEQGDTLVSASKPIELWAVPPSEVPTASGEPNPFGPPLPWLATPDQAVFNVEPASAPHPIPALLEAAAARSASGGTTVSEQTSHKSSLQPLALAARLLSAHKADEAVVIVKAVLHADPANIHAKAMLNLLSPSGPRRRRKRALLVIGAVLAVTAAAIVMIKLFS